MQEEPEDGLLRGAQAIADHVNARLKGGKKLTRSGVYRMVEDGKIDVKRVGQKRSEIWSWTSVVDRVFGIKTRIAEREKEAA